MLSNKFNKNNIGLYRDKGIAIFRNINDYQADKIQKEFHNLFKLNGLSLKTEYTLKTVNYLDITLDLNSGTYKPYCKPISTLNRITYKYYKAASYFNWDLIIKPFQYYRNL